MPIAQSAATIAESLLAEFEVQARVTRKFLERLPEDKLTWKPHEKSMSAGQLAFHIASVPGGIVRFVQNNPAQAPASFNFPQPVSRQEILEKLEESIATVREVLPKFEDPAMTETWHMQAGGRDVFSQPRGLFLRDVM
ncbi:MAG: DinB family protein [Terracidiphilus sp.]